MARQMVYGINDRPPLLIMLLSGAQHVLTLFGSTTLVPLIFGPAMGMDTLQIASFISCVYLGMGVATLIQTSKKLGSGLPIVQGSSFSFIPSVMTVIALYKAAGPEAVIHRLQQNRRRNPQGHHSCSYRPGYHGNRFLARRNSSSGQCS